jgi:tetratricopeptide (TPR) repeat protein
MRLTSSFVVFRADPEERDLATARWLAREGRLDDAEREYREVLARHPDLATGWMELFELVRREGRHADALAVADEAVGRFGPDAAMPLALRGAALAELGRMKDAIAALEASLERDGNLAVAWHELAYAAYRVGEYSRALLALDRAFALEPHTDSLMLRGRILREAGQYEAAEVAFEAAVQATEHDIPQRDARREVAATRRAASLGGRRPKAFTPRERGFVESGTVVLAETLGDDAAGRLATCLASLPALVRHIGWHPAAVAAVHAADGPLAATVARAIGSDVVNAAALDPGDQPLVVTLLNDGDDEWDRQLARLERWHAGTSFALVQVRGTQPAADVAGGECGAGETATMRQAALDALARSAGAADVTQASALASSPEAPWRRRHAPA